MIENEEISNLTQGHLRKLHTLELRYSVQLTVEKEVERIVMDGRYEDVLQVFGEILELLHEVEKDKHERNHAEMLSKDIQWKHEEDGTFEDYDGNLNAQIELAFQKNKSKIEIQMDEENYTVKFDTMTMEDEGGVATEVKRIDLRKGTMTACALSVSLNNASVAFCQSSSGSSDARDDYPLSAPAISYSGAVKRNVGEKDGKAPTSADGANADKEEEGKNGICYVQTL